MSSNLKIAIIGLLLWAWGAFLILWSGSCGMDERNIPCYYVADLAECPADSPCPGEPCEHWRTDEGVDFFICEKEVENEY